ncbi:unnamed protein product [Vitrella brassicaformis CCMP3155]|uniref:Uncharacterized protein n=1 Tax=Vitrella brassicaformis (strain CCMP3155) TaxID=1169540 RepID=A0A0G4GY34_VITBC|nr:unnamed protein product [Vitrella brassicaformis CCMP3155]|eukprot:CEM35938.1 unnamed protein product [Vitrella brassicaformis CCMP3155]
MRRRGLGVILSLFLLICTHPCRTHSPLVALQLLNRRHLAPAPSEGDSGVFLLHTVSPAADEGDDNSWGKPPEDPADDDTSGDQQPSPSPRADSETEASRRPVEDISSVFGLPPSRADEGDMWGKPDIDEHQDNQNDQDDQHDKAPPNTTVQPEPKEGQANHNGAKESKDEKLFAVPSRDTTAAPTTKAPPAFGKPLDGSGTNETATAEWVEMEERGGDDVICSCRKVKKSPFAPSPKEAEQDQPDGGDSKGSEEEESSPPPPTAKPSRRPQRHPEKYQRFIQTKKGRAVLAKCRAIVDYFDEWEDGEPRLRPSVPGMPPIPPSSAGPKKPRKRTEEPQFRPPAHLRDHGKENPQTPPPDPQTQPPSPDEDVPQEPPRVPQAQTESVPEGEWNSPPQTGRRPGGGNSHPEGHEDPPQPGDGQGGDQMPDKPWEVYGPSGAADSGEGEGGDDGNGAPPRSTGDGGGDAGDGQGGESTGQDIGQLLEQVGEYVDDEDDVTIYPPPVFDADPPQPPQQPPDPQQPRRPHTQPPPTPPPAPPDVPQQTEVPDDLKEYYYNEDNYHDTDEPTDQGNAFLSSSSSSKAPPKEATPTTTRPPSAHQGVVDKPPGSMTGAISKDKETGPDYEVRSPSSPSPSRDTDTHTDQPPSAIRGQSGDVAATPDKEETNTTTTSVPPASYSTLEWVAAGIIAFLVVGGGGVGLLWVLTAKPDQWGRGPGVLSFAETSAYGSATPTSPTRGAEGT